jgi:hypothetical protein
VRQVIHYLSHTSNIKMLYKDAVHVLKIFSSTECLASLAWHLLFTLYENIALFAGSPNGFDPLQFDCYVEIL